MSGRRKKSVMQFRARQSGSKIIQFKCPVKCGRCEYYFNTRRRCKRRVCIGYPYCFQHLPKVMKLKTKESKVLKDLGLPNNKGIYASGKNIVFKAGDKIADYNAEKINMKELEKRYDYGEHDNTGPYVISNEKGEIFDAACTRIPGSLLNDPKGSNKEANAEFQDDVTNNDLPIITALRDIKHDEEILVSYGPDYWAGMDNLDITPSVRLLNRGNVYYNA